MGIKGLFNEIGPGERTALSKLAIQKLEETGRPLRIAIDVSIWLFQIQAAQGGPNPGPRTLYYRLLKLLSHSIQPIFVFDGPNRPPWKRNKKTGKMVISHCNTKKLIRLFGFPVHDAPGEAEAECAYLQREGVVDAVFSDDVDTLMFGCGQTLRNWSSEGPRGNKTPTHVNVYNEKATKEGKSGLDREGMILVALMSGGDYITEGIPHCGPKVACEAARAGYGAKLCHLPRGDKERYKKALNAWRADLSHELETNDSKYFKTKHKTLKIPATFPNEEVLGYYTHPKVSASANLERLRAEVVWDGPIDVPALRQWAAETLEWTRKTGARKFIRGLAPAMLVYKLRSRMNRRESGYGDIVLTQMNEMELIREICGSRTHLSTDGEPELRCVYSPIEIVGLNLDDEEDDKEDDTNDFGRDGLAPRNEDGEIETYESDDAEPETASPKKRAASKYDPTEPEKIWLLQTIVKLGVPLKVEDYEEKLRNPPPKKGSKAKTGVRKPVAKKGGVLNGAMDKFVKITKSLSKIDVSNESNKSTAASSQPELPPVFLAPTLERMSSTESLPKASKPTRATKTSTRTSNDDVSTKPRTTRSKAKSKVLPARKPTQNVNPWSIAQSSPTSQKMATITKANVNAQPTKSASPQPFKQPAPVPSISPSPISPPPRAKSSTPQKHPRSPSPTISGGELEIALPSTVRISRGSKLYPNTPSKSASRLSPRKKISPDIGGRREGISPGSASYPMTPDPVARKLDFASMRTDSKNGERSRSSSPELPSLARLLTPQKNSSPARKLAGVKSVIIDLSSSPLEVVPRSRNLTPDTSPSMMNETEVKEENVKTKSRKYIMLRESLPGSWMEIDEENMSEEKRGRKGTAWRQSQIEFVDLTEE